MNTRRWSCIAALFIGLSACSQGPLADAGTRDEAKIVAPSAGDVCDPLSAREEPLALYVQPESGTEPFTDAIAHAKTSIDVMVYQMGWGPILEGLEAKARAGVNVRVILDLAQKPVNEKFMLRLKEAGANVIWSDPRFVFMHAKLIVVDDEEAILSTGNYSEWYLLRDRNFAVRDRDPADLAVLSKLFDADFAREVPDLSCTRLLVSPVNARERLLAFIGSAERSVTVHSMQLGDRDVRDALAARQAAGVDVRVILADPSWIEANASAFAFLAEHRIPARWAQHVHVKAVVVDDEVAYVGSINLSWNSIDNNREVGLLVTEKENVDIATRTFDGDWATATPFSAPAPGGI